MAKEGSFGSHMLHTMTGTMYSYLLLLFLLVLVSPFMAPEIVESDDNTRKYDKAVDIWSTGIVMYYVC